MGVSGAEDGRELSALEPGRALLRERREDFGQVARLQKRRVPHRHVAEAIGGGLARTVLDDLLAPMDHERRVGVDRLRALECVGEQRIVRGEDFR